MKLQIFGKNSTITKKIKSKHADKFKEILVTNSKNCEFISNRTNKSSLIEAIEFNYDAYLITNGLIGDKNIYSQKKDNFIESIEVNLYLPIMISETILRRNKKARVIIMGSESAIKGSYDTSYFLSKAALERYVKERIISYSNQQLIMVSPSIILDSNMTQNRKDLRKIIKNSSKLPKGKILMTNDVVNLIVNLLLSSHYLTNEIININGGKFSRMIMKD